MFLCLMEASILYGIQQELIKYLLKKAGLFSLPTSRTFKKAQLPCQTWFCDNARILHSMENKFYFLYKKKKKERKLSSLSLSPIASKVTLFSASISYTPGCSTITLNCNYMFICLSSQKAPWGQ